MKIINRDSTIPLVFKFLLCDSMFSLSLSSAPLRLGVGAGERVVLGVFTEQLLGGILDSREQGRGVLLISKELSLGEADFQDPPESAHL